ncbi:MAG: methionyl-tRNA formyltransferase [Vicingaceae bacterium]
MKIVFMGTPDFAVKSLDALVENNYHIVGVVTAPDKPAGRGQKVHQSAVKKYALSKGLPVLQPVNLKAPEFINALKSLNADLQIVVAFRMLPEIVWKMPKLGTFNLHASLLPKYRGAAPINWAIINGEKETGVTTFFLQHQIDTGNIILQEKIKIEPNDTAGTLHDKLMNLGAEIVVKTVQLIEAGNYKTQPQNEQLACDAPKIFKNDCKINWNKSTEEIYNFIRGLSPYPTAWTSIKNKETGKLLNLKIFFAEKMSCTHEHNIGDIIKENKSFKIAVKKGYIYPTDLQAEGKKRLNVRDFLNGFKIEDYVINLN